MVGDEFLATCLAVGNDNEIALSELAMQRSQNAQVKEFARKMIDDHKKMGEKLRPFTAGDVTGEGRKRTDPRTAGETARSTMLGGVDATALVRELGRQCLDTTRKELEKKQGADFDKCYVGMVIGAHAKMNDELTVFSRHASDRLRTAIQECQPTVQTHLEHAKTLWKQLEGKAGDGMDHKDHDKNKDDK
jgi:putative membrane protein